MAKEKDNGSSGQRLTRLLILVGLAATAVFFLKPLLTGGRSGPSFSGSFLDQTFGRLLEDKAKNVLGQRSGFEVIGSEEGEVEPIAEPVSNLQGQTRTLLEAVKELPKDQAEAVKKQLCKEICGECERATDN